MIISRTPYRLSLLGGGTDYPSYFKQHSGSVLGVTIDRYCWLSVRKPTPFGPKYKVVYSKVEETDDVEQIQHPAVRECLKFLDIDGAEIYHTSDLPARSGVGSSSAFVVGLLNALHALKGNSPTWERLSGDATFIEREILNETVGCQDQILTAYGGLNVVNFPKSGPPPVGPIRCCYGATNWRVTERLEKHLMLFYTGVQRFASDIAATYIGNFDKHLDKMERLKKMVLEGVRILTEYEDINEFGKLLDESWQIKKSLGEAVSTLRIDNIYEDAKDAGAVGAKLMGAGGGGFMLLFVLPDKQNDVRQVLHSLIEVPVKFEFDGSKIVYDGGA